MHPPTSVYQTTHNATIFYVHFLLTSQDKITMDEVGAGNSSRKFSLEVMDSYIALRETEEAMGRQGEARKSVDFKRGSWVGAQRQVQPLGDWSRISHSKPMWATEKLTQSDPHLPVPPPHTLSLSWKVS